MNRPNWFIGWPYDASVSLADLPAKVRVFASTDLHVTSVFLGAVDEATAMAAWAALADVEVMGPVEVSLGRVRLLGSSRAPSAVSALIADGAAALSDRMLAHRALLVESELPAGADRPPLPHLTVARIQRSASNEQRRAVERWVDQLAVEGRTVLERLALYTWSVDRSRSLFQVKAALTLGR